MTSFCVTFEQWKELHLLMKERLKNIAETIKIADKDNQAARASFSKSLKIKLKKKSGRIIQAVDNFRRHVLHEGINLYNFLRLLSLI